MNGPKLVCAACGIFEVGILSPLCDRCQDVVHRAENNAESQAHVTANRVKFNRRCAQVLALLKAGHRLTVLGCAVDGISSLPRRILDLKEAGVPIQDEWVDGRKVYFLKDPTP